MFLWVNFELAFPLVRCFRQECPIATSHRLNVKKFGWHELTGRQL